MLLRALVLMPSSSSFGSCPRYWCGIEVGARLDSTSALPEMVHYFDHAIATATREYIDHPTSQQLHDRLAEKWQRPWPLANRINVQPQQDAWERLTDGTQNGPVLWRREPGQAVELLAGVERFQLAPAKNSKPTCKPGSTPGTRTETVRVDQNRRRDPRQPGKLLHPDTYDANFRLRTLSTVVSRSCCEFEDGEWSVGSAAGP